MTKAEVVEAIEREIEITQRVKDDCNSGSYLDSMFRHHSSGMIRGLKIALAIVKMLDDGGSE